MKKPARNIFVLFLVAGVVLSGWAFYLEPSSLRVRTYRIRMPQWGAVDRPLRVAVLGDLHVGSPYYGLEKLREVVRVTNEQRPDLVLLAGDYVIQGVAGGVPVDPTEIGSALAALEAQAGVFAVLGNHDYWWGAREVTRALEESGVRVLEDQAARVQTRGHDFWLVGISDRWEGEHDIERALTAVPPDAPTLAFTHNPDIFPEIPPRVGLTVAAHTHGGQVSFPFVGPLIVPSSFGARYAAGLIREGNRLLFVTTGLGTSILPVRFRVPPEVSFLEID